MYIGECINKLFLTNQHTCCLNSKFIFGHSLTERWSFWQSGKFSWDVPCQELLGPSEEHGKKKMTLVTCLVKYRKMEQSWFNLETIGRVQNIICYKEHWGKIENHKSVDKHSTQSTITQTYKEKLNLIIESQLQNENGRDESRLLTEQQVQ